MSLLGGIFWIQQSRKHALGQVRPEADRWHQHVTPGFGGVPMFFALILATALAGLFEHTDVQALFWGAAILFVAGFIDDIRPVAPLFKLGIQIVASATVVLLAQDSLLPQGSNPWYLLSALCWMVLIVNSINLLDNMDGLAAGIALIVGLTVGIVQWKAGRVEMALLFVGLSAALTGFLVLNVNPAKIFMGDAGSLWLGLLIGAGSLSIMDQGTEHLTGTVLKWSLPMVLCALPLLDTAMVAVTRWRRGQSIMRGGRDHLSHRLVFIGCSERVSVLALWLIGSAGASVALTMLYAPVVYWATWLCAFCLFACGFTVWISKLPVHEQSSRQTSGP